MAMPLTLRQEYAVRQLIEQETRPLVEQVRLLSDRLAALEANKQGKHAADSD